MSVPLPPKTSRGSTLALLSVAACAGLACSGSSTNYGVSARSAPLTVGGFSCPQTGTIAVSTIPTDSQYYLTTFTGGTMSCGGQANGEDLYIADRQRFGCGTHVRVTNPSNGKSCVTTVGDTGPNICVEEASHEPVIDASPAIAEALFGHSSSGWSDHALVTAAVTSDPIGCGSAPANTCTQDSDCNMGQGGTQQICNASGQCVSGCHVNADCPSGDSCDTTQSPATCVSGCAQDSDCNGGQSGTQTICSGHTCVNGCHASTDCPAGDTCDTSQGNGACVAPVQSGCQADTDCNGGQPGTQTICVSGQCVNGCHQDSDCPSGDTCDTSQGNGACVAPVQSGCQADTDCNGGQTGTQTICVSGQCVNGCDQDSDCPSGDTCDTSQGNGACVVPGQSGCQADTDCNGGQTGTQTICVNGQCVSGCDQDSDCPSGDTCDTSQYDGACVAPASGCQSDTDCTYGATGTETICSNGQCVGGCHVDSDCPGSETCDTSSDTCSQPSGTCSSDSDCNGGQTGTQLVCGDTGSTAGTCVSGCDQDSDCPPGGTCDLSTDPGSCSSAGNCGTDADCNGGQTGTEWVCSTWGSSTNTCITACHTDQDCPSGTICDTLSTPWTCD